MLLSMPIACNGMRCLHRLFSALSRRHDWRREAAATLRRDAGSKPQVSPPRIWWRGWFRLRTRDVPTTWAATGFRHLSSLWSPPRSSRFTPKSSCQQSTTPAYSSSSVGCSEKFPLWGTFWHDSISAFIDAWSISEFECVGIEDHITPSLCFNSCSHFLPFLWREKSTNMLLIGSTLMTHIDLQKSYF